MNIKAATIANGIMSILVIATTLYSLVLTIKYLQLETDAETWVSYGAGSAAKLHSIEGRNLSETLEKLELSGDNTNKLSPMELVFRTSYTNAWQRLRK